MKPVKVDLSYSILYGCSLGELRALIADYDDTATLDFECGYYGDSTEAFITYLRLETDEEFTKRSIEHQKQLDNLAAARKKKKIETKENELALLQKLSKKYKLAVTPI